MKNLYLIIAVLMALSGYGQTPEQVEDILRQYDLRALEAERDSLITDSRVRSERLRYLVTLNRWSLSVEMPGGNIAHLIDYDNEEKPIYVVNSNVNAARTTRSDFLNTGGGLGLDLNGSDMFIGVWEIDAGRLTHQELGGRVAAGNTVNPYVTNHANMVLGTLLAAGIDPNAKGMAPEANAALYTIGNPITTSVESNIWAEMTNAILNHGMLISNHSYGYTLATDPTFGRYSFTAQRYDQRLFSKPSYLMVVSAGNDGILNQNSVPMEAGYDQLLNFANCKNNLVVASAQDAVTDAQGNLLAPVLISGFSSEGPTDDLRIKPDITGNGEGVYSSDSVSDTSYGTGNGTSASAPNVAGSLLLLQEYCDILTGKFMRGATLKGLALHTADDMLANGPDAVSGWGLLNAKRAAETLRDNGMYSMIAEKTLMYSGVNATHTYTVYSDGIHPLQASISWMDPQASAQGSSTPANTTTPMLIRDLDIRITNGVDTYYPWRLTSASANANDGDNFRDNYERIDVPNAAGEYTITVTHKNFTPSAHSPYSLIVTGITLCSTLVENLTITDPYITGEVTHEHVLETITASNTVETGADVHYRAGDFVYLTDGFLADTNSLFLADIGGCSGTFEPDFNARHAMPQSKEEVIAKNTGRKVMVYPNPANGSVTVSLTEGVIGKLTLFTIDGKPVLKKDVSNSSVKLDLAHLERGLYLISIETNKGELINEKLVLN